MKNQPAVSSGEARIIDGVFVYRDTQRPGTWCYVPPFPLPETDTQGRPMAHLWVIGATANLQLGACWSVTPTSLDRIRQQLISEARSTVEIDLNLQPAPASITQASLTLNQDEGDPVILDSSTTAGTPPWSVIFNASISPTLLPVVRASFEEGDNRLVVNFHGEFTQWLPLRARITGDARQEIIELSMDFSVERARQQVDTALENGRLKLEIESPPGVKDPDLTAVAGEVRTIAARMLASMASQGPPGSGSPNYPYATCLTATAHRQTSATVSFTSSTALCHWFPDGTSREYVNEIGPE